jgi:hypothetical protein
VSGAVKLGQPVRLSNLLVLLVRQLLAPFRIPLLDTPRRRNVAAPCELDDSVRHCRDLGQIRFYPAPKRHAFNATMIRQLS